MIIIYGISYRVCFDVIYSDNGNATYTDPGGGSTTYTPGGDVVQVNNPGAYGPSPSEMAAIQAAFEEAERQRQAAKAAADKAAAEAKAAQEKAQQEATARAQAEAQAKAQAEARALAEKEAADRAAQEAQAQKEAAEKAAAAAKASGGPGTADVETFRSMYPSASEDQLQEMARVAQENIARHEQEQQQAAAAAQKQSQEAAAKAEADYRKNPDNYVWLPGDKGIDKRDFNQLDSKYQQIAREKGYDALIAAMDEDHQAAQKARLEASLKEALAHAHDSEWKPDFNKDDPYEGAPQSYIQRMKQSLVLDAEHPLPEFTGKVANAAKGTVFDETGKEVTAQEFNARLPEIQAKARVFSDALMAKDNIQLPDKSWMPKDTYNNLDPKYQDIARNQGLEAVNKAIQDDVKAQQAALKSLDPYKIGIPVEGPLLPGQERPQITTYDINKFLRQHANDTETLLKAGFNKEDVDQAQAQAKALREYTQSLGESIVNREFNKYDAVGLDRALHQTGYKFTDDKGQYQGARTIWQKASEEEKQKIAEIYSSDPNNKNAFASAIASLNMVASEHPYTIGLITAPISAIGTPIAKATTGQKVEPIEIVNAAVTAALIAAPLAGNVVGRVIQGGAGILFTKETVDNWGVMDNGQKGLSVAMDTLLIASGIGFRNIAKAGSFVLKNQKGGGITLPGLTKQVVDNVKANDLKLNPLDEARLKSSLTEVSEAIKAGDSEALAKAAGNLDQASQSISNGATRQTLGTYAKTMKANPDAFLKMAEEASARINPRDLKSNIQLVKDINESASMGKPANIPPEELLGTKYTEKIDALNGRIRPALESEGKLQPRPEYLAKKDGNTLPSTRQTMTKEVPVEEFKKQMKAHRDQYDTMLASGKVKKVGHYAGYENGKPVYKLEPESYTEWTRNHPGPQREVIVGKKDVPLSPTEYEFYKIAKKELKNTDPYGLKYEGTKTPQEKAVIKEQQYINTAKNRVASIKGTVSQHGLDVAIDMFGKKQVNLVYPKLTQSAINAARKLGDIQSKKAISSAARRYETNRASIIRISEGRIPSQAEFDNLVRTGKIEAPRITSEELTNYIRTTRAPSTIAMDIASSKPNIQVTEGGGWKFTPSTPNKTIRAPIYTADANLVTQVMHILSGKQETALPIGRSATIKGYNPPVYGEGERAPGLSETFKREADVVWDKKGGPIYKDKPSKPTSMRESLASNPEELPIITNEFPVKEMTKLLKSGDYKVKEFIDLDKNGKALYQTRPSPVDVIAGKTIGEKAQNLVDEITQSVKQRGMTTTVMEYGVNATSAVYPYYFENVISEEENQGPPSFTPTKSNPAVPRSPHRTSGSLGQELKKAGVLEIPTGQTGSSGRGEAPATRSTTQEAAEQERRARESDSGTGTKTDAVSRTRIKPGPNPSPYPHPSPNPNPQPNPDKSPSPSPQPKPAPNPNPNPDVNPEPQPEPEPTPNPAPKPTPVPPLKPVPPATPNPDLLPEQNILKIPADGGKKTVLKKPRSLNSKGRTERTEWPDGTIVWNQGTLEFDDKKNVVTHISPPPYEDEYTSFKAPKGMKNTGLTSPRETIQALGGKVKKDADFEIGFSIAHVRKGSSEIGFSVNQGLVMKANLQRKVDRILRSQGLLKGKGNLQSMGKNTSPRPQPVRMVEMHRTKNGGLTRRSDR